MNSGLKTVLDFMLDYGEKGYLPNMDEGGSGEIAYAAALRLRENQSMTRDDLKPIEVLLNRMQQVLVEVRTRHEFEIMDAEYKAAVQSYVNLLGWLEVIPDDQKPAS